MARSIYRLPAADQFDETRLGDIVGTPAEPRPSNAAAEPPAPKRAYITQRWIEKYGPTENCARCRSG
eukprot:3129126-Alexandrium_andersonii.AAC.1